MIKIRYSDLPAGLHVSVAPRGTSTIIYLRPGLTLTQRRAALLRARRTANMGYGPSLPASGVAMAVMLDRLKVTSRNGAAALRSHPLLLLSAAAMMTATAVLVMTAAITISIRRAHGGQVGTPFGVEQGVTGGQQAPNSNQGHGGGTSGHGLAGHRHTRPRPSGSPSRSPSPGPTISPSPSPAPSPTPSGSPSPSPSPQPSPSTSPTRTCLYVGPLGICLHL